MKQDSPVPKCAIILARESGDFEEGTDKQLARLRRLATHHGWIIGPEKTHVIIENGTSAFQRKIIGYHPDGRPIKQTDRPDYRRVLGMLYNRKADGLLVDNLDRMFRDVRDCEDLIDVVEDIDDYRVPILSNSEGIVMADDSSILMSRFKTASSNMESRNTKRRVRQSKEERARAGLPNLGGGLRPYGFAPGGMELVPEEAEEIQRAAQAVLSGATVHSVVNDLQTREVPTVLGGKWNRSSLAGILTNPRVAGLTHYKGKLLYKDKAVMPAGWPAIITEEEWRGVCRKLEARSLLYSSPGPARKYIGSGIYECGVCGNGQTMFANKYQYRCGEMRHLARNRERVDDYVIPWVTGKLSRSESALLLRPRGDTPDIRRMTAKAAELSATRECLLDLAGTFDPGEIKARAAKIDRELAEINADLDNIQYGDDPLAGIAGDPNAAVIWETMSLEQKRLILRNFIRVVILPARVPKFFSTEDIRIAQLRSAA